MSAGQESGSPIRENRTLLPAPLPPDEARGTLAAAAGVSTVGLRPPFDTPAAAFSSRLSRRSHLDCRARGPGNAGTRRREPALERSGSASHHDHLDKHLADEGRLEREVFLPVLVPGGGGRRRRIPPIPRTVEQ